MGANPYFIQGPALISYSMGRTSGELVWRIVEAHDGKLPPDVHVVTANTGDEDPASLRFGKAIQDYLGIKITVLEFDPEAPHSTRVVTWDTASLDGRPMDAAIDSRPTPHLPNAVSRYCTGTTKQRRIEKFGRHWCGFDKWLSVRGIRADEPRRVASMMARSGRDHQTIALPLAEDGVTKWDVIEAWRNRPFDLELPVSAEGLTLGGNCKTCHLKRRSTLLAMLRDDPQAAERQIAREQRIRDRIASLPRRGAGPELRDRFFKTGESFADLLREAQCPVQPAPDLFAAMEESVDCNCTD